jgi:hypothetical protein
MRIFECFCNQRLFFESTQCTQCARRLGYDPQLRTVVAIEPAEGNYWAGVDESERGRHYRLCESTAKYQACNWLITEDDALTRCRSCRLNETIPDLSDDANLQRWQALESAKRRLLHTLLMLGLPFEAADTGGHDALSFEFFEDQHGNPHVAETDALTGHHRGKIRLNIAEADAHHMEFKRAEMKQVYRTLLGHFRHEIGHYYWDRLISGTDLIDEFRAHFGDERIDYERALNNFYAQPPAEDWHTSYISAYAQSHPLEDWAECWAHFLHTADTLETASGFHLTPSVRFDENFDAWIDEWMRVTIMLNEFNRGMGLRDAYPFVLTPPVVDKLRFIRNVICLASPAR